MTQTRPTHTADRAAAFLTAFSESSHIGRHSNGSECIGSKPLRNLKDTDTTLWNFGEARTREETIYAYKAIHRRVGKKLNRHEMEVLGE